MNGRNFNNSITRKKQTGAFAVELAVVAPLIAMILVFASDMVGKQSIKGRLQTQAYSAVSIIKERTELYEENPTQVTKFQAADVFDIVKSSMGRTMAGFEHERMGYHLEQQKFEVGEKGQDLIALDPVVYPPNSPCQPTRTLATMEDLHIQTSWDRPISLYQVTLCYWDNNSFGNLVGGDYALVKANAIMLGR